MTDQEHTDETGESGTVTFTGTRWGLFGVLFPGYLLMLPTIGIYRFWQLTRKRHYYWGHTAIDGDALEYTGTARQLLIGFLIAVAFFLPLYLVFFYLSTQTTPEIVLLGYAAIGVLFYFLMGYASYRARRFRLSRTLWRGVRFGQSGNAWAYALRRFLWTLLVIVTAGLAYPFMAASLWRYRYNNTWFGDRQFTFTGSWRTIAAPFYIDYFILAVLIAIAVFVGVRVGSSDREMAIGIGTLAGVPIMIIAALLYLHLRSRIMSRFYSSVRAGEAKLRVRVRARSLLWLYIFYGLMAALVGAVFAGIFGGLIATINADLPTGEEINLLNAAQVGWTVVIVFGLLYLAFLAAYGALAETIIGLGYWRLIARDAVIENSDDLKSVNAYGEESPVAGEGIADALNVGAY